MALEDEEKEILYDVMQAITIAHDLFLDNKNINKKRVEIKLTESGIPDDVIFPYWFYTILFSTTVWRIGFDKAVEVLYGSLSGVIAQYQNGNAKNWSEFSLGISQTREMSETIVDFLFGFRGSGGESENEQVQSGESN